MQITKYIDKKTVVSSVVAALVVGGIAWAAQKYNLPVVKDVTK